MRLRSWFFLSLGLLLAILTGVALNRVAQQSAGPAAAAPTTVTTGVGENPKRTQTTIQNLEVLQVIGPTPQQPQRGSALTFIVDHQTALVLKYLRDSLATIDVAVRSRAESQDVTTRSVDITYLVTSFGIAR